MNFSETLTNDEKTRMDEHMVLDSIKKNTGILSGLHSNVSEIIDYAFTELLNNAYEHSNSKLIQVKMKRDSYGIMFRVNDEGIGIFNSLMTKYNLPTEIDAIGDLLKGKRTTAPEGHSGEGIFFTSKVCDNMIIQSSSKRLIFNNVLDDVFIRSFHNTTGTKVSFFISTKSTRELTAVFNQYTDEEYEFSKTSVTVKLYKTGSEYISRSQARRITAGLEKFKTVMLDFKGVDTVGQGFADEVFRVWKNAHPGINIITENENENINFMIKRAIAESRSSEKN
jgi:anti-sigma regulatory factor (Ser/Thr protein kinase)